MEGLSSVMSPFKPLFFGAGKEKIKSIGTENGYCKMLSQEQSLPLWHFRVHKTS